MDKIELHILALTDSETQKGNYALILEESSKNRRLAIIIGTFEAQAIAIALEGLPANRPLTHDLFKNFLEAAGIRLEEVIISGFENEVFSATLIGNTREGETLEIDARTSDAVALAIRFGCPIYTTDSVLEVAGIPVVSPKQVLDQDGEDLSKYSIPELERLLEQVLAEEDYESAVRIRNAIKDKQ